MAAVVATATDYLHDPSGIEGQGPFRWRLLAEGDSWLDRSTPLAGSLPQFLARELDRRGQSTLIIHLAHSGDTLRHITSTLNGPLAWWLEQFTYDAILLSAGGNDLIDAALDPPAGQGIVRNMAGRPTPVDAQDCLRQAALQLLDSYLSFNFGTLYQAIRSGRNARTPVLLNGYDTPTARNAPAAPGMGPWLYRAYRKNQVPPVLWPALTALLFQSLRQTMDDWCTGRKALYVVPTTGVLRPAPPDSTGSSGDWANEIHPNAAGWKKLAVVWADTLQATA